MCWASRAQYSHPKSCPRSQFKSSSLWAQTFRAIRLDMTTNGLTRCMWMDFTQATSLQTAFNAGVCTGP